MPFSRGAVPMPESVSTVDAILDGLRERKVETPYGYAVVFAAVEEAVHAAADARTAEIVDEIRDGITMIADNDFEEGANAALTDLLALVARRFPNGGTHDGRP